MTKTINRNDGKYRNSMQNNVLGSISIQNVQIWAKCRQIGVFHRVFFEPLLIFCCIPSGWARKWPRTSRYSLITTEICDKTTELLRFHSQCQFCANFVKFDPLTEISLNLCSFFVVIYQPEHKNDQENDQKRWQVSKFATKRRFLVDFHTKRPNLGQIPPIWTLSPCSFQTLGHFLLYSIRLSTKMTKTINRNDGKYRNSMQNNVLGSISIQNVQIWAKCRQIGVFHRVFFEPLLIFCCIPSGWARKWPRTSRYSLITTEICDKTTELLRFHSQCQFCANFVKFDPLTEISLNLCSFFVVIYQPEHKNDQENDQKRWQVSKFATKRRFLVDFHTKRPNLGQIPPIWTLSPCSFQTLGHFLLYSIRLSTKMTKTINRNDGKYRNSMQNNVLGSISIQNVQIWAKCRQIGVFHRVFFEPLLIFCCIPSGWARKWPRTSRYSLITTEICDKTTELLRFHSQCQFCASFVKFDPLTEISLNLCPFFVVIYQPEHKNDQENDQKRWQVSKFATKRRFLVDFHTKRPNLGQIPPIWTLSPCSFQTLGHFLLYSIRLSTKMTKTINRNDGKYRNSMQNNVLGSISIQNVQIWAKCRQIGVFHRVFFEPLLIFCCIPSGWARKWPRTSRYSLITTEICDKTTELLRFHSQCQFCASFVKFDPLTEISLNLCSFFVVIYQPEHKNDQENDHKRWQVSKFATKRRFLVDFHTKRPNLGQIPPIWTLSPCSFQTLGHFLLYSIRLSTKMTKTINRNDGKYRNSMQNNVLGSISIQNVQIWAKCRQIGVFHRVFFEPLLIFCCIPSGWARKWPRTSRYSLITTEICDKTTELLRFHSQCQFCANFVKFDPLTEISLNLCSFFVVIYQPEHKNDQENDQKRWQVSKFATKRRFLVDFHTKRPNLGQIPPIWTLSPCSFQTLGHFLLYSIRLSTKMTKTINRNDGKYRNSMQNNVLGSISIQNVQIWAKCRQIGVFHRVFFEPLLIFCCIPSGWARKWPRTSRYSLITTEICDKTTELLRFHSQCQFCANFVKFDPLTEISLNLCSFFVVIYQPEHKNDQENDQKRWQVSKFATKRRFLVDFHTKRPNLGQIPPIWTLSPCSFQTLGHFLLYSIRLSTKMTKTINRNDGKYRNSMQNNVLESISIQNVHFWAKCRQIGVFHRVFFEPLLIFCCIPSGWARKWPRTSRYSLITTEICDKTTELLRFHSQCQFCANFVKFDPLTEISLNLCSFFVVIYQPEHKNDQENDHKRWQVSKFATKRRFLVDFHTKRPNLGQIPPIWTLSPCSFQTLGHFLLYSIRLSTKMTKTINRNDGKYRNSMQNNVLGSISIQNVQIWAKCRQIGVFHRVFFEPLLIFCCIPSGWARKWPRTSRYSLITTEICDKTTELLRFHSQCQFCANFVKFDPLTEISLNLCSFFVVIYQPEHKNDQENDQKRWQVSKFATKRRFLVDFHTKRPNFTLFFSNPWSFFVAFFQAEHKNDKDNSHKSWQPCWHLRFLVVLKSF